MGSSEPPHAQALRPTFGSSDPSLLLEAVRPQQQVAHDLAPAARVQMMLGRTPLLQELPLPQTSLHQHPIFSALGLVRAVFVHSVNLTADTERVQGYQPI